MKHKPTFFIFLLWVGLALSSCSTLSAGPLQTESRLIELGEAESAQIQVSMGAGRLRIEEGSQALLEGAFTYNVPEWRPEVTYTVDDGVGQLIIQQPSGIEILPQRGVSQYDWNLRLSDRVPLSMNVVLGAGEAQLYLSELRLSDLSVATGAGNTIIHLNGNWQHDLNVDIRGGVGQIDLSLPGRVGIRLETSGLAVVEADGLTREGNVYTNPGYGQSQPNLSITFQAGLGALNIDIDQ
jgi:hypothetical protein